MRIERNGDSFRSYATRFGYDAAKNLPVPTMHAVKVAHRRHRGTEPRGNLRKRAKHPHFI
jgi:hypothetical protein